MRRMCVLLLFCLLAAGVAGAQTIQTVAGGAVPNNVPAISAPLNSPRGMAVDSAGNYYVVTLNHVFKVSPSGQLTVVAGDGSAGYSGDGGPATSASLGSAYDVAVDSSGNIYIADSSNNVIRKVDASGIITTVAGNGTAGFSGDGGPATSASLSYPMGVAVDTGGDIFIADSRNNRIRMVDPSGIIMTIAGTGALGPYNGDGLPGTETNLSLPEGVTAWGTSLLIADTHAGRVLWMVGGGGPPAPGEPLITVAGGGSVDPFFGGFGGPATGVALRLPTRVVLGGAGFLIADAGYNAVFTMPYPPGQPGVSSPIFPFAGDGAPGYGGDGGNATQASLTGPQGVAFDPASGNTYISDTGNLYVRKVDPSQNITTIAGNGSPFYNGDGEPATSASLNGRGAVVDANGNLYIPDGPDNRIRKVDTAGIISTVAGNGARGYSGDGGPATAASLTGSQGVAMDSQGNLYIADSGNNVIRKVDTTGTITTVAGNGTAGYSGDGGLATGASLNLPGAVSVDASGNLYIADTQNNVVRKVDTTGTITTVAGNGTAGYSGDGGAATGAGLNQPEGVWVDTGGDFYIADTLNNRIREVNTSGIITTIAGSGTAGYSGDGAPATGANLAQPWGVTEDGGGNLFINDTGNHVIRKVDTTGTITTVAGTGTQGLSGDGGPAASAELGNPLGLAFDQAGDLFFGDGHNFRVREITHLGVPTANTPAGTNVAVSPSDSSGSSTAVALTFSSVAQAGNTTLTTSSSGPQPPAGFQLGQPPLYLYLSTTAVYSGGIQICVNYANISYTDTSQLSIWHYDTTTSSWTELTTTLNTTTQTACATSPSLSPFALFAPAYQATVESPIAADGSSVFQANRGVVPVKFTLTLGGVATCTLPQATISVYQASGTAMTSINQDVYSEPSDTGSYFRIDSTDCQYVYNLDTGSFGSGTYRVNISIGGSVVGSATFGLQ